MLASRTERLITSLQTEEIKWFPSYVLHVDGGARLASQAHDALEELALTEKRLVSPYFMVIQYVIYVALNHSSLILNELYTYV